MTTLVDESLSEAEEIVFEGNTHDEAIRMRFAGYVELEKPVVTPRQGGFERGPGPREHRLLREPRAHARPRTGLQQRGGRANSVGTHGGAPPRRPFLALGRR
jgi:hypothetical protein